MIRHAALHDAFFRLGLLTSQIERIAKAVQSTLDARVYGAHPGGSECDIPHGTRTTACIKLNGLRKPCSRIGVLPSKGSWVE